MESIRKQREDARLKKEAERREREERQQEEQQRRISIEQRKVRERTDRLFEFTGSFASAHRSSSFVPLESRAHMNEVIRPWSGWARVLATLVSTPAA